MFTVVNLMDNNTVGFTLKGDPVIWTDWSINGNRKEGPNGWFIEGKKLINPLLNIYDDETRKRLDLPMYLKNQVTILNKTKKGYNRHIITVVKSKDNPFHLSELFNFQNLKDFFLILLIIFSIVLFLFCLVPCLIRCFIPERKNLMKPNSASFSKHNNRVGFFI